MLLVSTDSLFVRLAEASGWDVAFLVAVCSIPVYLGLNTRFGSSSPIESLRAYRVPLIGVAVLAAVSQIAFINAVTRTDVANVVVIVAATPITAAIVARFALGERVSARVWIAIWATVVGVVIVVAGSLGEPNLTGDLLALLAILAFSVAMSVWRSYPAMNRFVGLTISAGLVVVFTAPFAAPLSHEPRTYLAVAAMGLLFNPVGRIAHTNAPRFAPAAEVALFTPVETIAATTWAWLAFGENPTLATIIGGSIVILGILFGTFGARTHRPPAAHTPARG